MDEAATGLKPDERAPLSVRYTLPFTICKEYSHSGRNPPKNITFNEKKAIITLSCKIEKKKQFKLKNVLLF